MLVNPRSLILVCCVACGSAVPGPAAGASPSDTSTSPGRPAPAASKDAAPAAPAVPDQYKLNMLIRTTIIAVNQANRTGNYSVLRDLGSPNFQSANSVAKLTEIFSGQRNANLDLSPVLFFTPKLIRAPAIDANGMLRLTGFFETRPQQVNFDLAFEFVQGEWRHFAVAVATRPAPSKESGAGAPKVNDGPARSKDPTGKSGATQSTSH